MEYRFFNVSLASHTSVLLFYVAKTMFRWCVDSELLQKHHLISPDDYYSDIVPFCSAPKGKASVLCWDMRSHSGEVRITTTLAISAAISSLMFPPF